MDEEIDIQKIAYGSQVTFEYRNRTVIGEVKHYLGEDFYEVEDEDDNVQNLLGSSLTLVED